MISIKINIKNGKERIVVQVMNRKIYTRQRRKETKKRAENGVELSLYIKACNLFVMCVS
jgi:hypothetical protein